MRLGLSFLSAVLTPTLLIVAWYLFGQFVTFSPDDPYIWVRTGNFFLLALMITVAYVLILGVPAYLLLKRKNIINFWTTIGTGFMLGIIPIAIIIFPSLFVRYQSSNGVDTVINGIPTIAGWIEFLKGISFFGACGIVGALAFWLVWRHES